MTAVESIIEFCKKQKNNDVNSHKGAYSTIIKFCEEQAKEMEKQQIIDAWDSAYGGDSNHEGEQYYNETFKNE
jgi:hypothetical protein